ncbi:L-arabinose transport system permease protein AraQ [Caloramator mitchellensis]|uniref:L-arabinose transport system permease protein AraQ n=1 Tax=Caloramator mitchellensis TaxID=908809 RepID=A0A0R3K2B2_CALMK|nr:carbohydrate ABC transporter permease [Caloramator mitchellensis]KRQ87678.1 L-arabinose transport system permease protein AraQ [Caloramator mitchellensis]
MQELVKNKEVKYSIFKSYKNKKQIKQILIFSVAVILAIIWLVPLLWIVSTAFKPESDVIDSVVRWIPKRVTLDNFRHIFSDRENAPIIRWFFNSLFIATSHTILILLFDSLAAFAYARLKFKYKETIYWIMMATMMIPTIINFIPVYVIVDKFGWIDTPAAMIFPGLGGVFGVFLLRQFFEGIPRDLDEAAKIDGAGYFTIYFRIILPLAKPALMTLAIFTFMGNWNDFLWPILVTNNAANRTLPAGLAIFQGAYIHNYGILMAGALMSAVPPIILFLAGQKYFVKGIALSGLKE